MKAIAAPKPPRVGKRRIEQIALVVLAAAWVVLVLPRTAQAIDIISTVGEVVLAAIGAILFPIRVSVSAIAAGIIGGALELSTSISSEAAFTIATSGGGFHLQQLGGNHPMSAMYNFILGAYPQFQALAYSILGIVMGLKTLRMVQEPDNSPSGLPYIEKIGFLLFKFIILKLLIDYAVDIAIMVFNEVARISQYLDSSAFATASGSTGSAVTDLFCLLMGIPAGSLSGELAASFSNGIPSAEVIGQFLTYDQWKALAHIGETELSFASVLADMVFAAIPLLIMGIVIYVISLVSIMSRWLQLFVYLVFSPVALAFYGLDETKQITISYFKSILASAVAFLITVVLLKGMKSVIVAAIGADMGAGLAATMASTDITSSGLQIVGYLFVFAYSLTKAGSWAHDLIGG